MAPGPLPKPTAIKEAEGNPGKQKKKAEPKPPVLVDLTPPSWLSSEARALWVKLAPEYRAAKLLTVADEGMFAALCEARARYEALVRDVDQQGEVIQGTNKKGQTYTLHNPLATSRDKALDQYIKLASHFGSTPAARVRLGQDIEDDKASAVSQFFKRHQLPPAPTEVFRPGLTTPPETPTRPN